MWSVLLAYTSAQLDRVLSESIDFRLVVLARFYCFTGETVSFDSVGLVYRLFQLALKSFVTAEDIDQNVSTVLSKSGWKIEGEKVSPKSRRLWLLKWRHRQLCVVSLSRELRHFVAVDRQEAIYRGNPTRNGYHLESWKTIWNDLKPSSGQWKEQGIFQLQNFSWVSDSKDRTTQREASFDSTISFILKIELLSHLHGRD